MKPKEANRSKNENKELEKYSVNFHNFLIAFFIFKPLSGVRGTKTSHPKNDKKIKEIYNNRFFGFEMFFLDRIYFMLRFFKWNTLTFLIIEILKNICSSFVYKN